MPATGRYSGMHMGLRQGQCSFQGRCRMLTSSSSLFSEMTVGKTIFESMDPSSLQAPATARTFGRPRSRTVHPFVKQTSSLSTAKMHAQQSPPHRSTTVRAIVILNFQARGVIPRRRRQLCVKQTSCHRRVRRSRRGCASMFRVPSCCYRYPKFLLTQTSTRSLHADVHAPAANSVHCAHGNVSSRPASSRRD